MRHNSRSEARQAVRVTDLEKFQRACRVFLARLLMVHGTEAPEVLRQLADELKLLEVDRIGELPSGNVDPSN